MPWYEIQYETGRMSVANYADDAEAQEALKAHNDRAENGESGAPAGVEQPWPAERIRAVYVYENKHPDDYNPDQTMSSDAAKAELDGLIAATQDSNKVVNVNALGEAVKGLSHPFVVTKEKPFDSNYKMEHDRELDLGFLSSDAAPDAPAPAPSGGK